MIGTIESFKDLFLPLGICGGLGASLFVLRDPRVGVLLVAASIPLEAAGRVGYLTENLAMTVSKFFTVVTLVAWCIHVAMRRLRFRCLPWMYFLPCFWVVACLSLIGGSEIKHGVEALFRLATTVVFFFLVVQLVDSVKLLKWCLMLFVLVSGAFASYALVQRLSTGNSFDVRLGWEEKQARRFGVEKTIGVGVMQGVDVERSSGVSSHSIVLSLNVALLLAPAMVLWSSVRRSDVRRFLPLILAAIFIATSIATYARTGVFLMAFGFALMILWGLIRLTPARIVAFAAVLIVLAATLPESFRERVLSGRAFSTREVSIATRLEVVDATFQQFLAFPILGVGYGNRYGIFDYYTSYPDKEHAVTPHNAYLQMAAQTGIVGLAILLTFFWNVFVHMRRAIERFGKADRHEIARLGHSLNVSLLVFLFAGFGLDSFDKGLPQAWILVGLCGAYVYLAGQADKKPVVDARTCEEAGLTLINRSPARGVS